MRYKIVVNLSKIILISINKSIVVLSALYAIACLLHTCLHMISCRHTYDIPLLVTHTDDIHRGYHTHYIAYMILHANIKHTQYIRHIYDNAHLNGSIYIYIYIYLNFCSSRIQLEVNHLSRV